MDFTVNTRHSAAFTSNMCFTLLLLVLAGTSVLYNMNRLEKDNNFFKALGDTDELNASIGLAREFCDENMQDLNEHLIEVQSRLLDIGSVRK